MLEGQYDFKCDVWAIGVISYMLLSGSPPFYGKDDAAILASVETGQFSFNRGPFKAISEVAKDFISKCLTMDPVQRPTAEELLKHDWFKILHLDDPNHQSEKTPVSLDIMERLKGFQTVNPFARLCMEVLAHTLSSEQIHSLKREFDSFDLTESGEITYAELKEVLLRQGHMSEEDIQKMFAVLDADHTGRIRYHEFLAATVSVNEIREENMQVAFERLSKHKDNITEADLVDMLGSDSTHKEVAEMLKGVNVNPRGSIKYDEVRGLALSTGDWGFVALILKFNGFGFPSVYVF